VQAGPRDQRVHQPGVGQRDQRVVVAGKDQRGLPDQRQERQAGPARAGGELVQVTERRADAALAVHERAHPLGIIARRPAVEDRRDRTQVAPVQVAAWGHHVPQHTRPGRHHQRSGRRADEHQPPAAVAAEGGEVLGDPAAPGDAEHVGLVVAQRCQQARHQPAHAGEAVRQRGLR